MMYYCGSDPSFVDYLRTGGYEYGFEAVMRMRASQNPKERMKYLDIVNEAAISPEGRAAMIQKLYDSILRHKDFDTKFIADSKGTFTKFKYYQNIMSSVDTLNQLCGPSSREVQQLNKLVDILLKYRADFEYGYKFDIDFIRMYYEVIILALFQIIDFGICNYVETIKPDGVNKKALGARVKYASIVNSVFNTFEKGDWTKLVAAVKKDKSSSIMESLMNDDGEYDSAMEDAFITPGAILGAVKAAGNMVSALWASGGTAAAGAAGATAAGGGATVVGVLLTVGIGSLLLFIASVLVLGAIKIFAMWWYNMRFRLSDYLNRQAELLKYNTKADDKNYDKKQQQIAKLSAMANFIAVKTSKAADDTDRTEEADNKANYSTSSIRMAQQANATSDAGDAAFEF